MTEALAKVREELGPDAIIMGTRSTRKGGVFDLINRSEIEVTAAVDDRPTARGASGMSTPDADRGRPMTPRDVSGGISSSRPVYQPPRNVVTPADTGGSPIKNLGQQVKIDTMMDEIRELKRSLRDLSGLASPGDMEGLPRELSTVFKRVREAGMDERIAKRFIRQLLHELNGSELTDHDRIVERGTALLLEGMGDVAPIQLRQDQPRVVTFIGPTGSGKTTTIAKLATEYALNMDKKVSVLTIDTKRVDAVGQLKAYCRIINIPLYIAYSPDEIPGIMPGIMESDLTLVDTPGSGPMDRQQMLDMVDFLQKLMPQEVHLVMSVTTSLREMQRIADNFGMLKPNRVLFTKLDETEHYGAMLSYALIAHKALSYITFGQDVPGDFAVIDPKKLIEGTLSAKQVAQE